MCNRKDYYYYIGQVSSAYAHVLRVNIVWQTDILEGINNQNTFVVGFQYCVPVWNATYLHDHIKLSFPSVFKIQETSDAYSGS